MQGVHVGQCVTQAGDGARGSAAGAGEMFGGGRVATAGGGACDRMAGLKEPAAESKGGHSAMGAALGIGDGGKPEPDSDHESELSI